MKSFLFSPRWQFLSGAVGFGLILISCLLGLFLPHLFFQAYLTAYLFWIEITLGCMALLFLQYLTGGLWGACLTRFLEAGMLTLPWCGIFTLPLLLAMAYLFPWVNPVGEALHHWASAKQAYLNVPFFVGRNLIYFTSLSLLAGWFRRLGIRREEGDEEALHLLQTWSGPALIVFVLLMNFFSVDWIMSLKPEWYSSMLVVEFVGEQAVATLAGAIVIFRLLNPIESVRRELTVKVVHDLGNLLLGFICFWTYVTFMEYIITWTGNLPHEISWFVDRSSGGWKIFAVVLVLSHFLIPLFCLIFTAISKNLTRLAWVAGWVLGAHLLQVIWWVAPAFKNSVALSFPTLLLLVGLGALWLVAFARNLAAGPLILEQPRQAAGPGVPA